MKRPRIVKIAMQISSANVKARVEVKSDKPIVKQQITFITPRKYRQCNCNFTWIFKGDIQW